ncbi:MAG TPA: NAD(P)-dependent oxidoreductase [Candidatus Sumerlaeota bacterium]|nr:NAD(P)-dependent oxidoreductase [Candidatus Sumerlaeota bacterium]HPS01971.1 NAD(P)-dependent oxidoreductase [Candidatus Sumerlaeota bacterium]
MTPPENSENIPTPRLGWIGVGVMGASMAGHLLAAGFPLTVFTRTRAKAEGLLDRGAVWADSPAAVAQSADVIFTMVGFPQDVRAVYLGPQGLVAAARPGTVLVDMTTTEPSLAREIFEAAQARSVSTLDAPVSGGDVGARNATLSIMVGGEAAVFKRVLPLFEKLGRHIAHQGPAGAGQHTKMCNQIVIAGTMIGVCESLLYGYRAGLDLKTMLASIRGGAAGCWTLENLAPRILKRDFTPGFFVEHFIKDMGIALREARAMRLALPGLALVHQLYVALEAQGHGRCGTQALALALESLSGLRNGK